MDRVQFLISEFGSQPSTSYAGTRSRYTEDGGITSQDALEFLGDILRDSPQIRVSGKYLNRSKDETSIDHLFRVHEMLISSLERDFPPILVFRSFAAQTTGEAGAAEWNGLLGHAVSILELQASLEPTDAGFWLKFADSISGQIQQAFVYAERNQNFTATRGFSLAQDGTLDWNWVSDFPYLLVEVPSLGLLTDYEPWHVRTIVTLHHAIFRSNSVESPQPNTP